jgi:hypothetical protein
MLHNLSLETMRSVDCGQVADGFNAALRRAIQDCVQRPHEERVRKIILQAEFTPCEDGDDIEAVFQVQEKIPSIQSQALRMSVRKQGAQLTLVFQSDDEEAA